MDESFVMIKIESEHIDDLHAMLVFFQTITITIRNAAFLGSILPLKMKLGQKQNCAVYVEN